ncbi:Rhodanese-like domain-containing protein [Filobasidium floriforme]|uniref:Rhodanese-like domain-containing protein n=1 Tax=Filobasidium floriforme TaxID=5210 RepID=UPI001E8D828D|nr:Rhodanese-like domain-containing protein [Filobasidium floriforme]KAH8082337.1 Rhodanese-like domain-containing protein [Filobasidium floriforme]
MLINPLRSASPAIVHQSRSFATSSMSRVPLLITPKQLAALPKGSTKILDASWHMPNSPRNPNTEFLTGPRIPQAIRWDVDAISVPKTDSELNPLGLGHMMPSPETFSAACRKRGIKREDHVVVYDSVGVFSAPRAAFTFDSMGHEKVSILDGGLPRWIHEGFEVDSEDLSSSPASEKGEVLMNGDIQESDYPVPSFQSSRVTSYEDVVKNSKVDGKSSEADLVLDARSRERWTGSAPEPRPNLSSGHIPNSLSLPFNVLLTPSNPDRPYTSYLPPSSLRETIISSLTFPGETPKDAQVRWENIKRGKKGVVWSCGSGMTACVGVWGMRVLASAEERDEGMRVGIYDESWTGYASREESEIVKGEE